MPAAKIQPSTRRLSEVARHVVIPSGVVTTGWPAVESRCREFGDTFDEWQAGAGKVILGKRADGMYAATVGGITLSIPRQVAKTFLVGRIIFALCVIFPGMKVLWTAHRTRTATNTFKALQGFARRKKVAPYVAAIRVANGEQEILFTNGSVIMFGAREAGFGRGFDEVDIEVFDEAQILTEKALEDMVAATNQSRHPHGALLFFMGTPPRPVDPGEAFTIRRQEALALTADSERDVVYIECSADEDADPDDQKQWAKANPSFPHRTPLASMLRLRKNLPSVDSWRREALGIWDPEALTVAKLDYKKWLATANHRLPETVKIETLVYDVDRDSRSASIAVGAYNLTTPYVEVIEHNPHAGWLPTRLVELVSTYRLTQVHCNGAGASASWVGPIQQALKEANVTCEVVQLGSSEYKAACGGIFADVEEGRLLRLEGGQVALDAAAKVAVERTIGADGGWAWDTRNTTVPISPLVAVTVARHLLPSVSLLYQGGFHDLEEFVEGE